MTLKICSGLHERYCLARAQTGYPVVITLVAKIPKENGKEHPFRLLIESNIDKLLHVYPLLSCGILDARTNQPSFYRKCNRPFTHVDILDNVEQEVSNGLLTKTDEEITAQIISFELFDCGEGKGTLSEDKCPLWRVKIHSSPFMSHYWFSLSVNHLIVDGRGAANLFELLLAKDISSLIPSVPLQDIPPTSDQVFSMSPPYHYLVPIVFKELMIPRLPSWFQNWIKRKPVWTSNKPLAIHPCKVNPIVNILYLDMDIIQQLKKTAQARQVKTINPLLFIAALVTTFTFIEEANILMKSNSPINIRPQAGPDATTCTGNYVALAEWYTSPTSSTKIWQSTREYANLLSTTRSSLTHGLWVFGMMNYIPDAMSDPFPSKQIRQQHSTATIKHHQQTSWEYFFRQKLNLENPMVASLNMSNLGVIKGHIKVDKLAWAQTSSPAGAPFTLDVCGYPNGLGIAISTRTGTSNGTLFAKRMKKAILILAQEALVPQDLTMAEMVQLIND